MGARLLQDELLGVASDPNGEGGEAA